MRMGCDCHAPLAKGLWVRFRNPAPAGEPENPSPTCELASISVSGMNCVNAIPQRKKFPAARPAASLRRAVTGRFEASGLVPGTDGSRPVGTWFPPGSCLVRKAVSPFHLRLRAPL